MKVMTIYAHHHPNSLCHQLLERFDAGLREAGHSHDIVDLHAIGFNPVLSDRDAPNWIDNSVPDDVLAPMRVRESMLARGCAGPPERVGAWWTRTMGRKGACRRA